MDKKTLKQEIAKLLKKEMSTTGTGASVTPGVGAGVATKYAFGKRDNKGTPKDWKPAPSIPNRKSKAMDYKQLFQEDNEVEILNIIKQKNLSQDDKIKWMFSFSGWGDKTPVEHTGTFIRWELILENGMTKPLISKYIKSAVGITAIVKDDKIAPNKLSFLTYYFNGKGISDEQKAFETLEKIYALKKELNENYNKFKNSTKTRTKPEQYHSAVKEVKKKVNEINRLFEYMDRLKSELNEGEEVKYKKYTEKAIQQIKEQTKSLFFKSTKLK